MPHSKAAYALQANLLVLLAQAAAGVGEKTVIYTFIINEIQKKTLKSRKQRFLESETI
jgi:hypothetical protein